MEATSMTTKTTLLACQLVRVTYGGCVVLLEVW